jgi:hypothetical protein
MSKMIRRIFFWLWPPYEAHLARLEIDRQAGNSAERLKAIQLSISDAISKSARVPSEMESLAKLVFETENKRKDTIEAKALGFVSTFGVAVSIASALPALLGEKWNVPTPLFFILGIAYVLGIVYLFTAIYWSIAARSIEGFAVPNADAYASALKRREWTVRDRIAFYLKLVKFNEPTLIKKANSLVVAEAMFIRGLVLISIVTIMSGVFSYFADSKQSIGCIVPSVEGLNYSDAEKILFYLGLQPIRSVEYDSKVARGSIVLQDPSAGSMIRPCTGNVTLVMSFGALPTSTPSPSPTRTTKPTQALLTKLPSSTP